MNRPDKDKWRVAMAQEENSLRLTKTWSYALLPADRKAIQSKWVYKIKRDPAQRIIKYKARLVAKGFTQKKGLDYHETFTPVVRMTSARIVLAIAVHEQLQLRQVDIDNAYLNRDIDTDLYMIPPQGWTWDDRYSREQGYVLKLNKNLYGIKQAGHIWNSTIHAYCEELGFKRTSADQCVYTRPFVRGNKEGCEEGRIMASLHVDDFLLAGRPKQLEWFRTSLLNKFGIKWTTDIFFLGIKISPLPDGGISLSQSHYLQQVLTKFNMLDCKPTYTPMTRGSIKELIDHPEKQVPLGSHEHSQYHTIVGKLMYAMVATRPDLAFALSFLGQASAAPTAAHMAMAIRVLAYVRTTLDHSLHFPFIRSEGVIAEGYSDSNYAESPSRKSTTGFCYFLNGSLTHWCSKLQACVATSTSVAEWFALYETVRELVPLRRLLNDLGHPQQHPTRVWEDNQTAIGLLRDKTHHNRTKHVDVKYH
uniref:Reverse transcriptase Ty1/copia-type domain-containing protein n=1 Tax=Caenorhabditis japonica TaxID=281687 RepID=A0A8R1IGH7_CAEJA